MINRLYWRNILKSTCKRVDRIISVSHSTKRDIERIFNVPGEKIDVVHEGVDSRYFNLDTDGKNVAHFLEEYKLPQRYILCVGTHAYKNIEGAVRSFAIIKNKANTCIKLVIAGNMAYLPPGVFKVIEEWKLANDVIFTGFFPQEDLKYLYQCAEVFLFPSFYEGFGLPLLEAFACGTPVVTSTRGSLPEVAGGAALVVNPTDPEEIAGAVLRIVTDSELRKRKREEGLRHVERFSWEAAAEQTVRVFGKVVEKNKIAGHG